MDQREKGKHRRPLPHDIPSWIDPSQEIYFITICCKPRHINQLCHPGIAEPLFRTVQHRHERHVWFVRIFLLMPDHIHALLSFPNPLGTMCKVISGWKAWASKSVGIHWQRDFFEHRLRQDESERQKADYILTNPVRAGLAKTPEDWLYVWFPT